MAIITIVENEWRIRSDDQQWIVQRYAGWDKKNEEHKWNSKGYFTSLAEALKGWRGIAERGLQTETLQAFIDECRLLNDRVENVLSEFEGRGVA